MLKILKIISYPFRSLFGSGAGNNRLLAVIFKIIVYILIPKQYIIINANGCNLGMDIGRGRGFDSLASGLILGNGYEIESTRLFKDMVKRGMNVIDIGAHIGYYTTLSSLLVGNIGNVWAFEPEMRNYNNLVNNIKMNHCVNVKLINKAVSNNSRKTKLFISDNASGECSLIEIKQRPKKTEDIETVALNELFRNIPIDVIKIDVEGGEMGVLLGAFDVMRCNPKLKLFIECEKLGLSGAGYSCNEFYELLLEYGFRYIYLIDDKKKNVSYCTLSNLQWYLQKRGGVNLFCAKEGLNEFQD